MNRAERRRMEKADKKYEQRQTFTKAEQEKAVNTAYMLGVNYALQAAKDVLGLGPKRLQQVCDRLKEIEVQHLGPEADGQLVYEVKKEGKRDAKNSADRQSAER